MVSGTISLPSSGCFSPFPHGTRPLSVSRECLALPDGPGGFAQGSSCPALLRIPLRRLKLRIRGCHPLRRDFPDASPRFDRPTSWSYYPGGAHKHSPRFGLVPVRSPLLGESLLFSFPAGTKMFQFPALASATNCYGWQPCGCRVVPFGNPGVKGRLRLTRDYRSLPRPSSPPRAKASAVRPSTLLMPGSLTASRPQSPVYLSFFTSPQELTTSLPSEPSAYAFAFASICENLMLD